MACPFLRPMIHWQDDSHVDMNVDMATILVPESPRFHFIVPHHSRMVPVICGFKYVSFNTLKKTTMVMPGVLNMKAYIGDS